MDTIFKFKQFEVDQQGCAMKINTDGVLLAAMATADDPRYILDIGTGTGVIALMLAQRFKHAKVEAVEIEETAACTAQRNFTNSTFATRLMVHHVAIEDFYTAKKFDLIVSNPPFFVNDLKNTNPEKGIARHTDAMFFDHLMAKVADLLTEKGEFWFILPIKQAELLIAKAKVFNLNPSHWIALHSDESKAPFRYLVSLKNTTTAPLKQNFYIYQQEKIYTNAYTTLLKDFFLNY